jgi:chromosome segregation ATPase
MSNNLTEIKKALNTLSPNKLNNIQKHLNEIKRKKNIQLSPAMLSEKKNKKSYENKIKEIYDPIASVISSKPALNKAANNLMKTLRAIDENKNLKENEKKALNSEIKKKLVTINNVVKFYGKEKKN